MRTRRRSRSGFIDRSWVRYTGLLVRHEQRTGPPAAVRSTMDSNIIMRTVTPHAGELSSGVPWLDQAGQAVGQRYADMRAIDEQCVSDRLFSGAECQSGARHFRLEILKAGSRQVLFKFRKSEYVEALIPLTPLAHAPKP